MKPSADGPGRRRGWRVLALAFVLAGSLTAQAESAPAPPLGEGPLRNDAFLPVATAAEEALAEGDRELERARAAGGAERERLRPVAFDAWFSALAAGEATSSVREAQSDGTHRHSAGLYAAVERRLRDLSTEERAAWTARFEPSAREALADAWTPAGWAEVERTHPATASGARAALLLSDRGLEEGRTAVARGWLRRARDSAELAGTDDGLLAAVERRGRWLADRADDEDAGAAPSWRDATQLTAGGVQLLEDPNQPRAGVRGLRPAEGVRPGLAWLEDGRIAVQTAGLIHLLRWEAGGLRKEGRFSVEELCFEIFGPLEPPTAGRESPGWPLLPATDGGELFLIQGRAFVPPGPEPAVEPNVLLCVEPPPMAGPASLMPLPRVRWAVSGDRLLDTTGRLRLSPELSELDAIEFQPGPIVIGSRVLVQARAYAGATGAWCLAFDRWTGELVWKAFLAQGSDTRRDAGRFAGGGLRLAAQPLVAFDGRVFAATNLGVGALLDLSDGRPLWSLKTRRREAGQTGWGGARPPRVVSGAEGPQLVWGPADSDRLYVLRGDAAPAATAESIFAAPPRELEEAERLLGADEESAVVLGRAGPTHTLSTWRLDRLTRHDALHLGPDERFRGYGLVSETRVLAATDRGLFLFDRERDLYLVDYAPLIPAGTARGGDVLARGTQVLVLGADALWAFEAR